MVVNLWTANPPSLFDRIKNTVKWTQTPPWFPLKNQRLLWKLIRLFLAINYSCLLFWVLISTSPNWIIGFRLLFFLYVKSISSLKYYASLILVNVALTVWFSPIWRKAGVGSKNNCYNTCRLTQATTHYNWLAFGIFFHVCSK